jgi:hypothetical protein
MLSIAQKEQTGWWKMKQKVVLRAHSRAPLGLNEQARIERGNNTLVRVCMLGFAIAIVAIAPVVGIWKIALFLLIMFVVGILMPAIGRARRNHA